MSCAVLLIGSVKSKIYLSALEKRYRVVRTTSGQKALQIVAEQSIDVIILDSVSMRTSGERTCRNLRHALPNIHLIHIHPGPKREAKSEADVVLFSKLTPRKLVNAIERLQMNQSEDVIKAGPFKLNKTSRLLITPTQEVELTPKVAMLVGLFLENPGKTLDRKFLMAQVWETEYLGDTRTLDVHIRWARQALESGKGRPKYLKTVRGVGYRLEIPDDNN